MTGKTKYLTVDRLIERLGPGEAEQILGAGLRGGRTLERARAETEILAVDALIEGYVRVRYPAGFKTIPALLEGLCYDIVRYRLRGLGGQAASMAEVVRARYEDGLKILKDIGNGIITLDGDGDGGPPGAPVYANAMSAKVPPARMKPALKGYLDR